MNYTEEQIFAASYRMYRDSPMAAENYADTLIQNLKVVAVADRYMPDELPPDALDRMALAADRACAAIRITMIPAFRSFRTNLERMTERTILPTAPIWYLVQRHVRRLD